MCAVYATLTLLATPGLDFLKSESYQSDAARQELRQELGPIAAIGLAAVDMNRALRLPLVRALTPLQRPFRIEQSWSFYQDGPRERYELEIRALLPGDSPTEWTPLYRTLDPELDWLEPQLRGRRLAPLVQAMVSSGDGGRRWRGVTRFVAERLRADHPQARAVALRALRGALPDGPVTLTHSFVAQAPEWTPTLRRPEPPARRLEGGP